MSPHGTGNVAGRGLATRTSMMSLNWGKTMSAYIRRPGMSVRTRCSKTLRPSFMFLMMTLDCKVHGP